MDAGNHSVGPWDLWSETGRDEITGFCVGGSQLRGRVVGLRPQVLLELHKFRQQWGAEQRPQWAGPLPGEETSEEGVHASGYMGWEEQW